MVLGAVLAVGHLEHVGDAEEGLLRVPVGDHLQDREVLQHAVHHVLLRQVLQLQDEVDHVLAHGAAVDLVEVAAALEPGALGLHLLDDLLAEAADLGGALDLDVLGALVAAIRQESDSRRCNERGLDTAPQLK